VKGGTPTDHFRMSLEPAAARGLNVLQIVKRAEDPIGKRLIGEWPQAFCGLQLGRMRRQKEQMKPFWNHEITTLVPARLIQNQENLLVQPSALFLCEGGQREGKGRGIDRRHEQPGSLAALWLHKPIEIHPLIARSDHSPNPAPFARPDPAQDRFEANAVLVLTPHFNAGFGIRLAQLLDLLGEFF
jgi:hypothetical protein